MSAQACPVCGHAVRSVGSDEGTQHYEPVHLAAPQPEPSAGLRPAEVARLFHEAYERLAPSFGYETRTDSAVPWDQVPEKNRRLMEAVAGEVLTALAADPSPALSVERLKAALAAVVSSPASLRRLRPSPDAFHTTARLIAAEYDRLTAEDAP